MISPIRFVFTALICTGLFMVGCGDSNQSSVLPPSNSDIVGTWKLEKESNAGMEDEIYTYTKILLKFTDSNLVFFSNNEECYFVDTVSYSYSGKNLFSDYESGEVSVDGSRMTVTNADKGHISHYSRYKTSVPPAGWPETNCNSLISKKRSGIKAIQY